MKKTVKAGVLNLCIFLLSLLILVPVCIVVLNSFKTQGGGLLHLVASHEMDHG